MNQDQNKHLRMFNSTQSVMDRNTSKWSTIPVIVEVKNEYDELIQRIEKNAEDSDPGTEKITKGKYAAREVLAVKAIILSGILQSFAAKNNDAAMSQKVTMTRTDVLRDKEKDVIPRIKPLVAIARENLESLAPYGLTEDNLTELETSIEDFNAYIGEPRTIKNSAYATVSSMDELFDKTNSLLKDHMDKLMIRFLEEDPEFYNEYLRARIIVD